MENASIEVRVLEGFGLYVGGRQVDLISSAQRLVAFLALQERGVARSHVAGELWPAADADHAGANLRSAVWRAQRNCRALIVARGQQLAIGRDVSVDMRRASARARRLLDGDAHGATMWSDEQRRELVSEVLPDWCDDWVIVVQEEFHQLRLHALESVCARLTEAGRVGEAVDAGMCATRAEPLRESAHRVLIAAHLAAGNRWEALRQFERCRVLLLEELELEPSEELAKLVDWPTATACESERRARRLAPVSADSRAHIGIGMRV
jgi:DNA-binding SARP family transcriptional activator